MRWGMTARSGSTSGLVLGLLSDGRPRRAGEVAVGLGIGLTTARYHLDLLWRDGRVLHSREPVLLDCRQRSMHQEVEVRLLSWERRS